MTNEQWQDVYDNIRYVRVNWACDENYDDKPGLPDMVMMAQEVVELHRGDTLVKNDVDDAIMDPGDWYAELNDLYRYLRRCVDENDRVEHLVMWMIECAVRMMAREFGLECELDLMD